MNEPLLLPADRPENIVRAAALLREGGVVVVPTDTLYGLAASVFRAEAVQRVYRLKARPAELRVPVLLATAADLPILADAPPRVAWKLIDAFWPGKLTIVLPAGRTAPRWISQGRGTVALRVPGSKTCLQVLEVLGEPMVGTSANRSGERPALTAAEALDQLPGVDAALIDDAAIEAGLPSTIVEVSNDRVRVIRVGAISSDDIRSVVGAATPVEEALPQDGPGG